jgi:hypothetical protein
MEIEVKHGIEIAVREFIQALGLGPEKPRAWKRYDLTKEERSEVFKGGVGFSFKLDSVCSPSALTGQIELIA